MTALSVADDQLRAFIERIERLEEEKKTIADHIKEVYAEAKDAGFDKTAMGALVSELRAKGKDAEKFETANSILDLYRTSYERASHTHAPARTREGKSEISPDPRSWEAADGQPGIPSDPAAGAKSDGCKPSSVGAGVTSDGHSREGSQAVTIPPSPQPSSQATAKADDAHSLAASSADNFEPPAFLRERAYVLRPHCLRPDNCGSYGAKHCGSCERAARESEAA